MSTPSTISEARLGRYRITKDSPVKVAGKRGAWLVVGFYPPAEGGTEVRVEVRHAETARTRIYPLSKIGYIRPSSERGKTAAFTRETVRLQTAALTPARPVGRRAPRKAVAR